jgi:hypothetical protein
MEAKPATGGVPNKAGARKQTCYAKYFSLPPIKRLLPRMAKGGFISLFFFH